MVGKNKKNRKGPKIMFFVSLLVLLAIGLYFILIPVFQVFEDSGVMFYVTRPVQENTNLFEYELAAGDSERDSVSIYNGLSDAVEARLYVVDSELLEDGSYASYTYHDEPEVLGAWFSFEDVELGETVVVEGKESKEISFDVSVPEGAELGEYDAFLILAYVTKREGALEGSVVMEMSTAVRAHMTVAEESKALERPDRSEYEEKDWTNKYRLFGAFIILNLFLGALFVFVHKKM
jgi:hypothetical protein